MARGKARQAGLAGLPGLRRQFEAWRAPRQSDEVISRNLWQGAAQLPRRDRGGLPWRWTWTVISSSKWAWARGPRVGARTEARRAVCSREYLPVPPGTVDAHRMDAIAGIARWAFFKRVALRGTRSDRSIVEALMARILCRIGSAICKRPLRSKAGTRTGSSARRRFPHTRSEASQSTINAARTGSLAGVNNFFRSRHLFLSGRVPSAVVHLQ